MNKFLPICLSILFVSCSMTSKIVEVPVEITKTEYIVREVHDTTIIDNFIDRWKNGDTVYIKENHNVYRYINKHDTIIKIDSFPVYIKEEITKEVNKVPVFYKVMTLIGAIFCVMVVIGLILKIKK